MRSAAIRGLVWALVAGGLPALVGGRLVDPVDPAPIVPASRDEGPALAYELLEPDRPGTLGPEGAPSTDSPDLLTISLERTPGPGRAVTREAVGTYWSVLAPGGWLVISTDEELLFQRAAVTVWESLSERPATKGVPPARLGWGVREVDGPGFLLLLSGAPVRPSLIERFSDVVEGRPVRVLFGPGFAPEPPYQVLQSVGDPEEGVRYLEGAWRARSGERADLEATTVDRPFFFRPAEGSDPLWRWTTAAGLAALLGAILVPLGPRRRIDAEGSAKTLPVGLLLLGPGLASGTVALALVTIGARLVPGPGAFAVAVPAAALGGGLVAWTLSRLSRALPGAEGWGSLAVVAATLAATGLAPWMAASFGWTRVAMVSATLLTVAAGLGFLTRESELPQS